MSWRFPLQHSPHDLDGADAISSAVSSILQELEDVAWKGYNTSDCRRTGSVLIVTVESQDPMFREDIFDLAINLGPSSWHLLNSDWEEFGMLDLRA